MIKHLDIFAKDEGSEQGQSREHSPIIPVTHTKQQFLLLPSANLYRLRTSQATGISTRTTTGKETGLPTRPWPAAVFMTSRFIPPVISTRPDPVCPHCSTVPIQSWVPPSKSILSYFCHSIITCWSHNILLISKRKSLNMRSLGISIKQTIHYLLNIRISGFGPASFRGSQVNAGVRLEPFRKAASSFPIILRFTVLI